MIKLVIFDIAGTTILDKHAIHHAFIAALAEFGYNVSDKEARKVSGISKPLAIQMILAKKGQVAFLPIILPKFIMLFCAL